MLTLVHHAKLRVQAKKNTYQKRQVYKYNQVYRRIVPHSTLCPVGDEKTKYLFIYNVDHRH
ncbi:hypothetical protein XBI1_1560036 [Xenorhabdus bovienii str. Intermedium]|uniref:Uncharacterized protein n=1 Tax=Xenorhabdus bovienii str. Intermedium TaxID=1379677 RepID=A0A077QDF8_XENBV|nr:hypothetical protein XBI1_1560036 [Xenorhabdus bovienii str. Intermedium]